MSDTATTISLPMREGWMARQAIGPSLVIGVVILLVVVVAALGAPWLSPHNPNLPDLMAVRQPPSSAHWLGTDPVGRDLLSRILWGGRVSLLVSGLGMLGSLALGTAMGMLRGFGPSVLHPVVDRAIDIQLAFPYVLLAIAITSAVRPSIPILILLMVLAGWAGVARVVRAIALQEGVKDYVKAAAVLGVPRLRIAFIHVFPTVWPSLLVLAAMQMAAMIVFEATLSFLGMGVQPPTASWGGIMLDGKNYITSLWWMTLLPGLAIMATSLGLILIGDGLESRAERLRAGEASE